jgi:hypothetical protein
MAEPTRARDRNRCRPRLPATALVVLATATFLAGSADHPWLPEPCAAATLVLTGPPGAVVSVDGQPQGKFPLPGPLTLPPGRYLVQSRLEGRFPFETTVQLENEGDLLRLQVRLIPLKRKTAITSNLLLAGLGQHYMGKSTKGWIFNAAEIGGLLAALVGELDLQNNRDEYLLLLDNYDNSISDADIEFYTRQVLDYSKKMEDSESLRNTGLIVAAGAVVLSVLDAWLTFPSVSAGPGTVPVPVGSARGHDPNHLDGSGGHSGAVHAGWLTRF